MVVLATKVYVEGGARERIRDSLTSLIANDLEELDVNMQVGIRDDDFPTVTVSGPDAVAARNLLRDRWGAITGNFEQGERYRGTLESWDEDGIVLDTGRDIRIHAEDLDLGPGSPKQLRNRFGLVHHLPLEFVYGDRPRLSEDQIETLHEWRRGTGRVNVNSATRSEVRATVNRAGHAQDIVTVERLGLLEQSIVCREDTDPPGIVAAIGSYVPAEILAVVPK